MSKTEQTARSGLGTVEKAAHSPKETTQFKNKEQTAPKAFGNLKTQEQTAPKGLENLRTSGKPLQRNTKSNKPCERDERMYEQGTSGSKGIRQLENKPENLGRRRKPLNREEEKLRERNPPLERH